MRTQRLRRPPWRAQRGAALLLALIIMTLVVTLAAGMVWQHARAIQVESAERARAQSAWILHGALDWARLILREDNQTADHEGEPWAVPLAEARLSTFLAADRSGVADAAVAEDGPDAFLSGSIADAQGRWNLRNLLKNDGTLDDAQREVLQRICDTLGAPGDTAKQIADGYLRAWSNQEGASVLPSTMRDLGWLGIEPAVVAQLSTKITILPIRTKLNLNTASAEVMAAVIPGATMGQAQGIVEARKREYFKNKQALKSQLTDTQFKAYDTDLDVKTSYFEVRGRMRLDNRVLEEVSIVRRDANRSVTPIHRERVNHMDVVR